MKYTFKLENIFLSLLCLLLISFVDLDSVELSTQDLHKDLLVEQGIREFTADEVTVEQIDQNYSFFVVEEKSYEEFREKMGFLESRGNYQVVNKFGYMGKYQFGESHLEFYGVGKEEFLNSEELQDQIFKENLQRNKWKLRKEIKKYSNRVVDGVVVSESGILAAAHLAGVAGVKRYFNSVGKDNMKDAFGTSVNKYLREFYGFDLKDIKAKKRV